MVAVFVIDCNTMVVKLVYISYVDLHILRENLQMWIYVQIY